MNTDMIQIDMSKYPALQKMLGENPIRFKEMMKNMLLKAEFNFKNKYEDKCMATFHITADEMIDEMFAAMFDYRGILDHHHSKSEAQAMMLLEMENNPLVSTQFFSTDGKRLDKEQFVWSSKMSVREWFQSLLYAGRYLSHVDLVRYLLLSDHHMVENMKNEHIQKLLAIQPALKFQSENGIRVGMLVEGTGFFFVGFKIKVKKEECPVCKSKNLYVQTDHQMQYCMDCKAAYPWQ